jgi:hypothetical protein
VPVLGVSSGGFAGFAEFIIVEEAVQEGGAWVSGADSQSSSGEVFSGAGSV